MVLLRSPRTIDPGFVLDSCRRLFPASAVGESEGDDPFSFRLDDCSIHVAGIPIPIPGGEAEAAGEHSIMCPDASALLSGYGAHAIVHVSGATDHHTSCLVAQRAVGAVVDATEALCVYVGDAGHLVRADIWLDEAQSDSNDLVTPFWLGLVVGPNESGTVDGFTRGLAPFGVPELEIVGSNQLAQDVWGFLGDIGSYLIENGNVIEDGHTVGATEEQKVTARLSPSTFGNNENVLRLSF